MKSLVYRIPKLISWEEILKPIIKTPTDAVMKILKSNLFSVDTHILKGCLLNKKDRKIISNEGVSVIDEVWKFGKKFHKRSSMQNLDMLQKKRR
jgi:alcohol dehydrogenase